MSKAAGFLANLVALNTIADEMKVARRKDEDKDAARKFARKLVDGGDDAPPPPLEPIP